MHVHELASHPQTNRSDAKPTPFLWALLVLTVLVISRVHSFVAVLRAMRPAVLLVLFVGAYALMRPAVVRTANISKSWMPKVVLALAVTACLSIPFGISMGRAAKFFLDDYWKTILYAVLLVVGMRTPKDMYRVVWSVVIGVGILAFLSLFVFGISKTQGTFGFDANDVGLIMVTGLPLALLTLQASRPIGKILSLVTLLLIAGTIAKSQSRGAFVGLVVVGAVLLVTLRGVALPKRVAFVVVAAGAMVVAAPPGYWNLMHTLTDPQEDYNWNSTNGRRELVKRGFHYMLEYPLFGIGINNFPMAEGTISEKARNHIPGTGIRWAAAHNSYIQAGAEMGVPGLALWFMLLFGGMISSLRIGRRMPRRWKRGSPDERQMYYIALYLPVAMAGFAVSSFFVSFAYLEPVYILAALVTGVQVFGKEMLEERAALQVPASNGTTAMARRRRRDRAHPSLGPWLVEGPKDPTP